MDSAGKTVKVSGLGAIMTAAYLECVEFADFGEEGEPAKGAEFSPLAKAQAHQDCSRFLWVNRGLIPDHLVEAAGHSLWLDRNGHGSGFLDYTDDVWKREHTEILSRCARCMGEKSLYTGSDGLINFE